MPLGNKPFENTVGNGEIAQTISPLPTVFSTYLKNFLLFSSNLKLSSADCFNLDLPKILSSGNGLKYICTYLDFYSQHMEQGIMKISLCSSKSIWFANPQTR